MKIINSRTGYATNSSSTHYVVFSDSEGIVGVDCSLKRLAELGYKLTELDYDVEGGMDLSFEELEMCEFDCENCQAAKNWLCSHARDMIYELLDEGDFERAVEIVGVERCAEKIKKDIERWDNTSGGAAEEYLREDKEKKAKFDKWLEERDE